MEDIEKYDYMVMAFSNKLEKPNCQDDIMHICLYKVNPSQAVLNDLARELREFGLKDFKFMVAYLGDDNG